MFRHSQEISLAVFFLVVLAEAFRAVGRRAGGKLQQSPRPAAEFDSRHDALPAPLDRGELDARLFRPE